MFNYFKEYCNETTLHGFKYFVDEKRSKIEKFVKFILIVSKLSSFFFGRVLWAIVLIISTVLCTLLIKSLLKQVNRNLLVSYRTNIPVEVSSIPFPAVTYCPDVKMDFEDFEYEATIEALRNGNISIDDISHEK